MSKKNKKKINARDFFHIKKEENNKLFEINLKNTKSVHKGLVLEPRHDGFMNQDLVCYYIKETGNYEVYNRITLEVNEIIKKYKHIDKNSEGYKLLVELVDLVFEDREIFFEN